MNHNHRTLPSSQRQWSLDFLRILATFSVIVFHAAPLSQMDNQIGSAAQHAPPVCKEHLAHGCQLPVFSAVYALAYCARITVHLSCRAYGVYLVHAFLLELFSPVYPASAPGMVAGVMLFSLFVYLAADLISALLSRIPLLGKYIV